MNRSISYPANIERHEKEYKPGVTLTVDSLYVPSGESTEAVIESITKKGINSTHRDESVVDKIIDFFIPKKVPNPSPVPRISNVTKLAEEYITESDQEETYSEQFAVNSLGIPDDTTSCSR